MGRIDPERSAVARRLSSRLALVTAASGLLAAAVATLVAGTADGATWWTTAAVATSAVLVAAVAVLVVARALLRPVGELQRGIDRLVEGEPEMSGVAGVGGLADLVRRVDEAAAELAERRARLEAAGRAAGRSEERLRSVVDGVQDHAIVLLDVLGQVRTWNPGARRVTGWSGDDIVGRPIADLADRDEPPVDPLPDATRLGRAQTEGWYRRRDGDRFWGQLTVTALHREDGSPYGYAAILQDVTERWAARDALEKALAFERAAADELRTASDLKDDFLAVAAHEMRTPLSAILGAAQLLTPGREPLDPGESDEVVELIRRQADDLRDTVERMLTFSRLQAGRVELAPRPLVLRDELQTAVDVLGRTLADHRIAVEAPATVVDADAELLQQVTRNLLTNAAKFSPSGTPITLTGQVLEDRLRVTVADRGPGIAVEDRERIFELFGQGDHGDTTARGVGVGLALVASYVALGGGQVQLDTEPGHGASFTVELPLPASSARPVDPGRGGSGRGGVR